MGELCFGVGVLLTVLLVIVVAVDAVRGSYPLIAVDPEEEEDDDDTDLYTPHPVDVLGCPLDVSADTGVWVRAEGRVMRRTTLVIVPPDDECVV